MKQLHQKQDRKPIHTIPITTGTGKTVALTHLCTLSEFMTSNLIRKLKVYKGGWSKKPWLFFPPH